MKLSRRQLRKLIYESVGGFSKPTFVKNDGTAVPDYEFPKGSGHLSTHFHNVLRGVRSKDPTLQVGNVEGGAQPGFTMGGRSRLMIDIYFSDRNIQSDIESALLADPEQLVRGPNIDGRDIRNMDQEYKQPYCLTLIFYSENEQDRKVFQHVNRYNSIIVPDELLEKIMAKSSEGNPFIDPATGR